MKKTKYTKWLNEETGEFFYSLVLPDGSQVEYVPKVVGDYLHLLEQKLNIK